MEKKPPQTLDAVFTAVSDSSRDTPRPVLGLVVHQSGRELKAALEAADRGWVDLWLLGDKVRIEEMLHEHQPDSGSFKVTHASDPNEQLIILHDWCTHDKVNVLMQGDLTSTQMYHLLSNPLHRVSLEEGLSRVSVLSMPGYSKLLTIIGDVGPGKPDFDTMVIHMKNGVHLARGLNIERPQIALLSAMDEVGIDDLHTYNCQCIVSQVHKEQIPGVELEGPLSFDTAVHPDTVWHLERTGPVSGHADVVVVDSHQTRSVLVLTLEYFGKARSARVLLGGRVPVALLPPLEDEADSIAGIGLALYIAPYLKDAVPLDWLTHPDPMDYAW